MAPILAVHLMPVWAQYVCSIHPTPSMMEAAKKMLTLNHIRVKPMAPLLPSLPPCIEVLGLSWNSKRKTPHGHKQMGDLSEQHSFINRCTH